MSDIRYILAYDNYEIIFDSEEELKQYADENGITDYVINVLDLGEE